MVLGTLRLFSIDHCIVCSPINGFTTLVHYIFKLVLKSLNNNSNIVKMYKDKEIKKNVKNILLSMCDVKLFLTFTSLVLHVEYHIVDPMKWSRNDISLTSNVIYQSILQYIIFLNTNIFSSTWITLTVIQSYSINSISFNFDHH
jgi:hypothetical protein